MVLCGFYDKLFNGESAFDWCSVHDFCHIFVIHALVSYLLLCSRNGLPTVVKGTLESSHAFLTHIFYFSSDITNVVFLNIVVMLPSTLCPLVYKVFRI
jgi:hypothetical protein